MIPGLDNIPKLSKETISLITDLGSSKYYGALKELVEFELLPDIDANLSNPANSNDQMRESQGQKNGIIKVLNRIKQISEEHYRDN